MKNINVVREKLKVNLTLNSSVITPIKAVMEFTLNGVAVFTKSLFITNRHFNREQLISHETFKFLANLETDEVMQDKVNLVLNMGVI